MCRVREEKNKEEISGRERVLTQFKRKWQVHMKMETDRKKDMSTQREEVGSGQQIYEI